MRYFFFTLISIFSLNIASTQDATINVMSFNIRYPNPDDGENYWPHRKKLVASTIEYHEADIIGVQEAFKSQLDDLKALLPQFTAFGLCRTDGSENPNPDNEFSAILYKHDRFELLDGNTFWLSEQPEEIGKAGWDAALPRIVTWAKFKDKSSNQIFYHFNTHFDHQGKKARAESATLILQQIQKHTNGEAVILTGDFNCIPSDRPYLLLTDSQNPISVQDAYIETQTPPHGPDGTWTNSFEIAGVAGQRIDYIFVKNGIRVLKHGILSDSWGGQLPSDHLPVIAKLKLPNE